MSVGKIVRWNNDKGFGFIKSEDFNKDIFVHITAFPKGSPKPRENDEVVFHVKNTAKGLQVSKIRYQNNSTMNFSNNIHTPSSFKLELEQDETPISNIRPSPKTYLPRKKDNQITRILGSFFAVLTLGAIGYYGYSKVSAVSNPRTEPSSKMASNATKIEQPKITSQNFSCDGRKYCSQMTSKDEAQYFLAHCPDVKMDGDNDGDACEEQFGKK